MNFEDVMSFGYEYRGIVRFVVWFVSVIIF